MERIYSLDLLKFIAIILVILYHSYYGDNIIYSNILFPIYSIGVPLFFMTNGALLFNKQLNVKKHYKKIANIFLLTLIWTIIIISIISIFTDEILSFKEKLKIAWFGDSKYVVNQYWFLKALIIIYLFFPILKRAFDSDKFSIIIFLGIITILVVGYNFLYLSHQIYNFILNKPINIEGKEYIPWYNFCKDYKPSFSFIYFILGGVFFYFNKKLKTLQLIIPFFLAFFTAIIIAFLLNINVPLWDPCFDGYPSLMTLVMTTTIFLSIYHIKLKSLPFIIESISKNTLGIYLVHGIIIYFTKPVVSSYGINYYIFYALIILFISWTIVRIGKCIPVINKLFSI